GVEVTHRNVVNLLQSMARRPGMQATDVLLAVTPVTFDIAALELFLPLVVGGRVVIAARETASDGGRLRDAIAASGATILQATPATWRMLAAAGFVPGEGLKVLCGGEALPADLAAHLTSTGAEVWNMYGPTETTIWSTTARVRGGVAPSLGAPIANTSIHVLDQWLRPVAIGTPGEICIGGDGVARGYRGQPALTAAKFVAIPGRSDGARLYRTGDVGCLRADATLHYLGRSDDQIKIRGFRVEPAEIEAALADCPGVRQAAVIPHRAGHDDIRLVAFVRSDDADGGADQYRRQIAARLPGYMMPSAFVRVETLPLTPNGKINRQALSGAAAEAVSAPSLGCEPPRTPLERELAAIWAQVLGTPEVGVGTSFFELGGHSLLA
ncbi:MAG TPA: non-ribosomal peptide synthetase, partial [Thermomicrobiales bacterium]|nr:non-ribosomal peptide synthetase [Thermomicrobiales bacterium]